MIHKDDQKKEIQTIKNRNISIDLSDADAQRLWEKVGRVGISVSQLFENFVGDLVDGTYSNGSDERDMAKQWFDRCWFGMFPEKTFVSFLIDNSHGIEETLELWKDRSTAFDELEYANNHKEEFTEEDIKYWEEELAYFDSELNDLYTSFQEWARDSKVGTLEDEILKAQDWYKENCIMLDGEQREDAHEQDFLVSESEEPYTAQRSIPQIYYDVTQSSVGYDNDIEEEPEI